MRKGLKNYALSKLALYCTRIYAIRFGNLHLKFNIQLNFYLIIFKIFAKFGFWAEIYIFDRVICSSESYLVHANDTDKRRHRIEDPDNELFLHG